MNRTKHQFSLLVSLFVPLLAASVALSLAACGQRTGEVRASSDSETGSAANSASGKAPEATLAENEGAVGAAISAAGDSARSLAARADQGRLMSNNPDAMWVVMLSDYQCPFCKQWHDSSMAKLEANYVKTGKIQFAYVHLPLTSIHPHAQVEAEAAMCASAQGKFWQYSDALFAAQPTVRTMSDPSPLLTRIAKQLALNTDEFELCRKSPAIRAQVQSDLQQAAKANISSTPAFVMGEFLIPGALPYPEFSKALDSALVMYKKRQAAQAGPQAKR